MAAGAHLVEPGMLQGVLDGHAAALVDGQQRAQQVAARRRQLIESVHWVRRSPSSLLSPGASRQATDPAVWPRS